jgi:hypothetical protein
MTTYSMIEQEIVALRAAWDMIDGMVNMEMFVKHPSPTDSHIMFKTMTHSPMFNVLLGDFLSQPADGAFDLKAHPTKDKTHRNTYLAYLLNVCDNPRLNSDSATLRGPVQAFADWLDIDCVVPDLWLPSISGKLDMRIKRISFLKICGDIAKHNFSRLRYNVKQLMEIFAANSLIIDEGKAFSVLPDFYENFHRNVFLYHSSTIAEILITYGGVSSTILNQNMRDRSSGFRVIQRAHPHISLTIRQVAIRRYVRESIGTL